MITALSLGAGGIALNACNPAGGQVRITERPGEICATGKDHPGVLKKAKEMGGPDRIEFNEKAQELSACVKQVKLITKPDGRVYAVSKDFSLAKKEADRLGGAEKIEVDPATKEFLLLVKKSAPAAPVAPVATVPAPAAPAPERPTDPALRTEAEVCARWNRDFPASAQVERQQKDLCDPGTTSQASRDEALRRTNLYRWLAGLPPVTEDPEYTRAAQTCAVIMPHSFSHYPRRNVRCYTPLGRTGAEKSNLNRLLTNRPLDYKPADLPSFFMDSVPHRLWILSPTLGKTGFGVTHKSLFQRRGGRRIPVNGAWGCQYVADLSGQAHPDFIAWPSPGPFPIRAIPKQWSFVSKKHQIPANFRINLTRESDQKTQKTSASRIQKRPWTPAGAYFRPRIRPQAGETYRIQIGKVFSYQTKFVDCDKIPEPAAPPPPLMPLKKPEERTPEPVRPAPAPQKAPDKPAEKTPDVPANPMIMLAHWRMNALTKQLREQGLRLKPAIQESINYHLEHFNKTYKAELKKNPGLKGSITIQFIINGKHIAVWVSEDTLKNQAVKDCVLKRINWLLREAYNEHLHHLPQGQVFELPLIFSH